MVKELPIKKSKLFLHCCCAVCALPVIDYLIKLKNQEIILYFYNPNISPKKEYIKRLNELKKISKIYNLKLIKGPYDHKKWLKYLKNNLPLDPKDYPENSDRCKKCFLYRIQNIIKYCVKNKYFLWTTTLSVNRFKDIKFINEASRTISLENNLLYLTLELDPYISHQKSLEFSKKLNIYRQKYCGCEFSLK